MSVLLLKTPGVIQTLGPVEIDPYWLRRGLQMVVDNGRVVFNREVQKFVSPTLTGGPKSQVSKYGRAMGFGTTYGLGTTDAIAGYTLAPPTTSKRSIVAELYPKTSGGGTLGRVFQDASGTGLASGEALWMNSTTGIAYSIYLSNSSSASQWLPNSPLTLNAWQVVGISVEHIASTVTPCYAYINGRFVVSGTSSIGSGSLPGSNVPTNMVFGNRASDSLRGWDGMQGLILIFDGFLEAKDHARLAANRRQVFLESRPIWVGAAAGGSTTITGAIGTAVASGLTGTVNANRTIAGALGTATASGFRGVVNANRTIAGTLGTAVASGLAGNVNANRTVAGALGTATASGFQGTVTNGNTTTIAGSLGTAVATGFTGGVAWNRFIAGVIGVATASGFTGGVANGASSGGDGGTSKRKYYIRRRKQILIFDSVAQVDAYIEAEEEAAAAIAKAKSRGAKKRVIARVFKEQPEAVEITPLAELIESYKLPYNVGELIASENYQQIVDIQRIIQRIRDDEDDELLLLLA